MEDRRRQGIIGFVQGCGACPYLPGRKFTAFSTTGSEAAERYRELLDANFRRSGTWFYRPECRGCAECRSLRVDVRRFLVARDQRRCLRRNRDLSARWCARTIDDERFDLFRRYQRAVHDDDPDRATMRRFLIDDAGVPGGEIAGRDPEGRLLAVSVVDRFHDALSSVYAYYDPDLSRRSLGTWLALQEVFEAERTGMRWVYLGYHVAACTKMAYKARYRPNEVYDCGDWRPLPDGSGR